MKTLTYHMGDDVKKERGVSYIQYDTLEEALEAKGKDGVLALVNAELHDVAQGKASGKKNVGKAKVKTEKATALDGIIAAAKGGDAAAKATLDKYGIKF